MSGGAGCIRAAGQLKVRQLGLRFILILILILECFWEKNQKEKIRERERERERERWNDGYVHIHRCMINSNIKID